MHPNPVFRGQPAGDALAAARARGFGVLTVSVAGSGPMAAHVPFLLDASGAVLEAHLLRSNPIARALAAGPMAALLIVSGPDGYVSPDWYGEDDRVPTWNYLAVHLTGTLALQEAAGMRAHLDRLSAEFEGKLPKRPWTTDKMQPDTLARMMRTIVPVRLAVAGVESTVKLNQNRSAAARAGAADAIAAGGTPGQETAALAALMRAVPAAGS
ncbi:MAG: FMN-binding negative transcriptional regulator [Pseudomonadota bacterium]